MFSKRHCGAVVKGVPLAIYLPKTSTPLASIVTGYTNNWNLVVVSAQKTGKKPQANTGLTFYNRDEILFDAARGRVGLNALAAPGDIGKCGCN